MAAVEKAEESIPKDKTIPSEYLSKISIDLGSFSNGLADGIIDASPVGVFKFAWEVTTDKETRETLIEGVKALAADPVGVVQSIAAEKYNSWKYVLDGKGTEQQKYNVGADLGNLIGTLITGAGIKKVFNEILSKKHIDDLVKGAGRTVVVKTLNQAVKAVDDLIKPKISILKKIYPDAKMGYRGSLATGKKYSTGGPFDPSDWDVDAFIVSDELGNVSDVLVTLHRAI